MRGSVFFHRLSALTLAVSPILASLGAQAEPAQGIGPGAGITHGIAMYGTPALPEGFPHLPYANPQAPKGGTLRMGETGSFDSLNPWVLAGRPAQGISSYVTESLMLRSYDEPFTLYGLLAESVTTDPERTWVEFTLRPEARFSDGAPVTVEDVIWSYETLGTAGAPRYQNAWGKVAKIEQTGERSLRITFSEQNRELALIMGLRPVLEKAQWQGHDFATETQMIPVGSGPYVIERVDMGRVITLKRNADWWAKDLPLTQGLQNIDTLRWDYFGDSNAMFEAFKAGDLDLYREGNPVKWARDYTFPAMLEGLVVKEEIPRATPSGIKGLVMNTRKPIFADWRVREALIRAFNFEFINTTLTGGVEPRISSYFGNSPLALQPGPASGKVAALLEPFKAELFPGTVEGYTFPASDGSLSNRRNARAALKLLAEAGWEADAAGVLKNGEGAPFTFEIVLPQGSEAQTIVDIYVEALRPLGIFPTITVVDDAQFQARKNGYDFDMTWFWVATSLSPGNEQYLYWGSQGVTEPGSRNLMGMNSPAAEAMIAAMLDARDTDDFTAAVRALDRVLTAGRYVIPVWFSPVSRVAHTRNLHSPTVVPLYGDWPGVTPDAWWIEAEQ
ncbi:peptide/nickel transport system substrate-binding protein [Rhodobacter sp. JA431]|uniref:extracellular solute-binding protein n=1 Tax=Rhodobacter sp. JA431 TaxID=570013 RepID=UPI000BC8340B|nr:extracellular solute-binding protein [Rhodobacter sp. JA431]SOB98172.1 peptide/nickel transport system substrate-binding protein [Rhodobacter sp. JA431]